MSDRRGVTRLTGRPRLPRHSLCSLLAMTGREVLSSGCGRDEGLAGRYIGPPIANGRGAETPHRGVSTACLVVGVDQAWVS